MFGNINALSVNQYPTEGTAIKQADGGILHKYANLSQLSMWGVVFIPSSSTGLAMEFIGDAHDSTITYPASDYLCLTVSGGSAGGLTPSRGIN